jgi:hypothetical protein
MKKKQSENPNQDDKCLLLTHTILQLSRVYLNMNHKVESDQEYLLLRV